MTAPRKDRLDILAGLAVAYGIVELFSAGYAWALGGYLGAGELTGIPLAAGFGLGLIGVAMAGWAALSIGGRLSVYLIAGYLLLRLIVAPAASWPFLATAAFGAASLILLLTMTRVRSTRDRLKPLRRA